MNILQKEIDRKTIKEILLNKGKTLFTAGVGKGKTYNFINVCKDIIKNNSDEYLTLFLTPTKVLSEQNGEQYDIHTVISGVNEIKTYEVNTIVYDKLNLIIDNLHRFKDKKIILIIDEAHELIYAKNYRGKTLERIKQLESIAFSIIHLTATPTTLKTIYEYKNIIEILETQTLKKVNIIDVETNEENGNKIEKALINEGIKRLKQNKKSIILYNNHEGLNKIQTELKIIFPNKNITLMTSKNKEDNKDFEYLIQNNKIDNNLDLILCTSILNAGINIKNNNIELIYVANKGINLDYIKQFAGRTRSNNTSFTILKYKTNEEMTYKQSFEKELKKRYKEALNKMLKTRNELENIHLWINENTKGNSYEEGITFIKNYKNNPIKYSNCLIYNEDTLQLTIDKELLLLEVVKELSSKYNNLPKKALTKLLKDYLLCDNVTFSNTKTTEEGERAHQNITQARKEENTTKKEYKEEIIKEFKNLSKPQELIDILKAKFEGEEQNILSDLINSKPKETRQLYNKIINNDTGQKLINKIRKIYKQYGDIFKDCIEMFIINNFNDKCFKASLYKSFNKTFKDLNKLSEKDKKKYFELEDMYLNIRFTLDNKIQKRLTQSDILKVYSIITGKEVNPKIELTKKQKNKTTKEIKLIYKIQKDKKGYYISSLIK